MHKSGVTKRKEHQLREEQKRQTRGDQTYIASFLVQKSQLNDEISNSTRLIVPLDSKFLSGSNEPDALVHPQPPNTEV